MLVLAACVQLNIKVILVPIGEDASSAVGSTTSTYTLRMKLINIMTIKRRKPHKSQHDYPKRKEKIAKLTLV